MFHCNIGVGLLPFTALLKYHRFECLIGGFDGWPFLHPSLFCSSHVQLFSYGRLKADLYTLVWTG